MNPSNLNQRFSRGGGGSIRSSRPMISGKIHFENPDVKEKKKETVHVGIPTSTSQHNIAPNRIFQYRESEILAPDSEPLLETATNTWYFPGLPSVQLTDGVYYFKEEDANQMAKVRVSVKRYNDRPRIEIYQCIDYAEITTHDGQQNNLSIFQNSI